LADTWYYTTSYFNTKVVGHVLRNSSFSSSNAYVALFSGHPVTFGLGAELTGGGYSRVQAGFTVSGSTAKNTSEIKFPRATADWYSVVFYGIVDAATNGNILFWGLLPVSRQVYTGETFFISASALYIGLGAGYSAYLGGKILNHTLNNINYTSPGLNVFAALYNTLPNALDSGGSEINEANYSRLRISGSGWSGPPPASVTGGYPDVTITTTSTIDLPYCSDTQYSWGTINGLCLRDSDSGGNQLFRGAFPYPPTVVVDDSYSINSGDLSLKIG
jgi:hypothetical protein